MSCFIWNPDQVAISEDDLIAKISGMKYESSRPFDERNFKILAELSRNILNSAATRSIPQYAALGFWLRPASLKKFKIEANARQDKYSYVMTARGVGLHLPPTNVDTIFIYSWALSFLCGNANVVRLPKAVNATTSALLRILYDTLNGNDAADNQIFCNYAYSEKIDREIAKNIDLRLVWGGDEKALSVSRISTRPDGLTICFPNRKSICAMSVNAYEAATDQERKEIAKKLFNDIYWFDQMGCGSPKSISWIGAASSDTAARLYADLSAIISKKKYQIDPSVAVNKFVVANSMLADGSVVSHQRYTNELHINRANTAVSEMSENIGGGVLLEHRYKSLDDIVELIDRSTQTITHFGFSDEEIRHLCNLIAGRGGYRIVPIGEALNFDAIWDGVDLLQHMTRKIVWR